MPTTEKAVLKHTSSFFQAKIAFEIPGSFEVEHEITGVAEIPDALVDELMALFPPAVTFESANICSPPLLIVDLHEIPTAEIIADMRQRIDAVLEQW